MDAEPGGISNVLQVAIVFDHNVPSADSLCEVPRSQNNLFNYDIL